MTILELYIEGKDEFPSLKLFIDFLVFEKKVLKLDDPTEKLDYYLQDRFHNKMNEYLAEYKAKQEVRVS